MNNVRKFYIGPVDTCGTGYCIKEESMGDLPVFEDIVYSSPGAALDDMLEWAENTMHPLRQRITVEFEQLTPDDLPF